MLDIKRLSPATLSAWYMTQPDGDRACSDCGKIGPKHYVQPQHPYYADGREGISRCSDCITAINRRMAAERKAQLATMERCHVDGCKLRGTFTVAHHVLMCGRHLKAAQREHNRRMASCGGMGLFMTPDCGAAELLKMARG